MDALKRLLPYLIGLVAVPLSITAAQLAVGNENAWTMLPWLYLVGIGCFVGVLLVSHLAKRTSLSGKK